MSILKIYTDGACSGNQSEKNVGGWGAVLEYGEHQKELFGGQLNTTNNRMEMMALVEALSAVKKDNQTIEVFSDSSYLMNCFREKWYEGWLKNNWMNSSKKPVENRDLWEQLLTLIKGHRISFYRVKGHVNLNSKTTNFNALYEKFIQINGARFSFEDFQYIIQMNNRVDALANKGINQVRESL
ncbi:ribonuclease HI [Aminipila butyrica]|uniref:ribonuclease H n=1 Tax=Aminipila butyrica TaxID=433296 RepID=A0A858BRU4_9FIRM|nr:ribonuclease H [Aminipila butyrica]QIB67909.1 ribonuclease HI [Aminipila butyrica]